jgi:hypothetical protein
MEVTRGERGGSIEDLKLRREKRRGGVVYGYEYISTDHF